MTWSWFTEKQYVFKANTTWDLIVIDLYLTTEHPASPIFLWEYPEATNEIDAVSLALQTAENH